MGEGMGDDRPVSAALSEDVATYVRRHTVAVWLDVHGHFDGFVDRLATTSAQDGAGYAVRAYRGSFLELMLGLDGVADDAGESRLLVHLPGFTEETVKATPLYELYLAGARYRKGLAKAVTDAAAGRVRPEVLTRFLETEGLTLDMADAWLAEQLAGPGTGLAAQLQPMALGALVDDLRGAPGASGYVSGRLTGGGGTDADAVWEVLAARCGVPDAWRAQVLMGRWPAAPADVAFAVTSWALAVEFVTDLEGSPRTPALAPVQALPEAVRKACCALAVDLRTRDAAYYTRTADETEDWLEADRRAATAETLGRIDTFRFEERRLYEAALGALGAGRWAEAAAWAAARLDGKSVWVRDERRDAWTLVRAAAALGDAVARAGAGFGPVQSLAEAVDAYVERGAEVDRAHRELEQRREALLFPQLPDYEALRACLDGLRERWREWADGWARDFNVACRSWGFLPDASLQQRTLFDEVVRPLTREGAKTAYFMVDALRFEMGQALARGLEGPGRHVRVSARLAELPTVTEVGMNALAPVAVEGALTPVIGAKGKGFTGLRTGEFQVTRPDDRRKAMHGRVGGDKCPLLDLDTLTRTDKATLKKQVASATLVVVHSREIDEGGHSIGAGAFEAMLRKLRGAWQLLWGAGVRRFVITADHGFLLLDGGSHPVHAHGRRVDPKQRYVLSEVGVDHAGEVRVALTDLRYAGVDGMHLMCPETTALFEAAGGPKNFVHGGNSLQERLVPVVVVEHRQKAGGDTQAYRVRARKAPGTTTLHALTVRLERVDQVALNFARAAEVELALGVDAPDVAVEVCHVRGATLRDGVVRAPVEQDVEVQFRLTGPSLHRVSVTVYHPGTGEVQAATTEARFDVSAPPRREGQVSLSRPPPEEAWLPALPEAVRALFRHLDQHGAVTEAEAMAMLGGASKLRRFSRHFDAYAEKVPFEVRIDVVAGMKRYVKVNLGGTQ